MNEIGALVLQHLAAVERERRRRAAHPDLGPRVARLKAYQQARFARTHADLLAEPRHAAAARFFLDELYGPEDFSLRDAQFARIVPAMVRLFPHELVQTVATLGELHALTERLDTEMGRHLPDGAISRCDYVRAWQQCDEKDARQRQIDLVLQVGHALDRYTRSAFMRNSLRLMRRPARLAGLGSLQTFLESGFDAFAAMKGAEGFLGRIQARERALANRLFAADAPARAALPHTCDDLLGQLP